RYNEAADMTEISTITTRPKRPIVKAVHIATSAAREHLRGWSSVKRTRRTSKRSGQKCKPNRRNRSIVLELKWLKLPTHGSKRNSDFDNLDSEASERSASRPFGRV